MKRLGVGLRVALAAYFLWAASVQLNDPDAAPWIAVYASAALAALAPRRGLLLALPVLSAAWAAQLVPAAHAEGWSIAHEVPREVFGLAIVAVCSGALAWRAGWRA